MNRIDQLFKDKQNNILSVYFSAGYPQLEDTTTIIKELQAAGADLIEVGMPFSDPLADGPTIQQSNEIALKNGMNLQLLFEQLNNIRKSVDMPLILMGYLNPVMQFGVENFCKKCQEVGIDGLILPDMPLQEFEEEYKAVFEQYGLYNIFLITPQTSEERIKKLDQASKGFLYMVSASATTGAKAGIQAQQEAYFKRIHSMNLKNSTLIGFGISDHTSFSKACEYANGVVIGSAFIKALAAKNDLKTRVHDFVHHILKPTEA